VIADLKAFLSPERFETTLRAIAGQDEAVRIEADRLLDQAGHSRRSTGRSRT
jgi:hypothetical protein